MTKKQTTTSFFYSALGLVAVLGVTLVFMLSHRRKKVDSIPTEVLTTADKEASPRVVVRASSNYRQEAGLENDMSKSSETTSQTASSKPAEIQASSPEIETQLSEAMKLVDSGNPKDALAILEKILKTDPTNEMALVEIGMIHLIDFKDPSAASGFLERAMSANPGNKVVLSELIGIYDETGHVDQGLAFLQTLYENNPDAPTLAMGIGQVLANQDRINEAIPYLKKAAEEGKIEGAQTELGDAYSVAGRHDEALDAYNGVVDNIKERIASGGFDQQPEVGQEKLAMAYMDIAGQYIQHQEFDKAKEIITEKVKELLHDDEAIASVLEQFQATRGGVAPAAAR